MYFLTIRANTKPYPGKARSLQPGKYASGHPKSRKSERNVLYMRKTLFTLLLCAALPFLLAGCGNGKVESTVSNMVSQVGEDIEDTASRVESAVESFFEPESSRLDEELSSAGSSMGEEDSLTGSDSGALDQESSISDKAR